MGRQKSFDYTTSLERVEKCPATLHSLTVSIIFENELTIGPKALNQEDEFKNKKIIGS